MKIILKNNILRNTIRLRILSTRQYSTKQCPSKIIRQQFLDFFIKENNHNFVKSSSVIPYCDPTLSFTNAGMNQFKNIFLGSQEAKFKRVANTQKCIRVGGKHNDLSVVGTDGYHHTFFEMLGNWSFGDYFKKEACEMAWKLLTEVYKIPPERLYVTYFKGDKKQNLKLDYECRDIWLEIGVPKDRLIACDAKDNFWEMAKNGPCGRSSEVHVDHLPTYRSANRARDVNQDKDDLTELWNIVFIENFRRNDGTIEQLQEKHVDTGMGFERLVAFLQGKQSNYDTDLFLPIFEKIEKASKKPPYMGTFRGEDSKRDTSYRILADHSRMIAISLADGMFPEQNQKLRRILRKSLNISQKNFSHDNLLIETIPVVANILGDTFPELHRKLFTSLDIVKYEADYYRTLRESLSKGVKEIVKNNPKLIDLDLYEYPGFVQAYQEFKKYKKSNRKVLSGEMTFQLYSSFGLDLDLIEKLAYAEGMAIDLEDFEDKMEAMKAKTLENSRPDNEFILKLDNLSIIPCTINDLKYDYEYDGKVYRIQPVKTNILALFDVNGKKIQSTSESSTENVKVIVQKSPFYYESGGQESDTGLIKKEDSIFEVNSISSHRNILFHTITVNSNEQLSVGDEVELSVDYNKRSSCIRNHSATHILNSAIRKIKNLPIYQKSSAVTSDSLKIEFVMIGPKLNEVDIETIESQVQKYVKETPLKQSTEIVNSQELQSKNNLIMVPGEIYPDDGIRVVSFGNFSQELCCGTHAFDTSELIEFTLTNVKSTGRISYLFNAVTGQAAIDAIRKSNEIYEQLDSLSKNISVEKFTKILEDLRRLYTDLQNHETSYLKRMQCRRLIDEIKETIKLKSRDALSELLDIEMKSIIDKNEQFVIHFLECSDLMKSVSLQKATKYVSDTKPVILISLADEEVKARCCVPKDMINDHFNAEKWLAQIGETFKSKVEAPKGQNPREVCFMKGRKIKSAAFNDLLEDAISNAQKYAIENLKI